MQPREMQDRGETGQEGCSQERSRTGVKQDRRVSGQEGSSHEICRTGAKQDRRGVARSDATSRDAGQW